MEIKICVDVIAQTNETDKNSSGLSARVDTYSGNQQQVHTPDPLMQYKQKLQTDPYHNHFKC